MPIRNAEKEESKDQWVVDIQRKYGSYDPREYDEKKERRSIYRWPNDLVAASSLSRHRAPVTVSLGPYHHGKKHLQPMEHHKDRALHRILYRSKIPVTTFIQSLQDVEQKLRDSYEDLDPKLSPHLFLRMMLLDGCFLLENQIPLLVLEKLLEVEEGNTVNSLEYLHLAVSNLCGFNFPIQGPCLHILDFYRECLIANHAQVVEETPISVGSHFRPWLHLAGKGLKRILIAIPILVFWLLQGRIPKHGHFRTAMRLHEAGIEFKKGEPSSRLAITFDQKNGILTLPDIQLSDDSPIFYMNLMAFVSNLLASDEDAAKLFNAFSDGIVVDDGNIKALRCL